MLFTLFIGFGDIYIFAGEKILLSIVHAGGDGHGQGNEILHLLHPDVISSFLPPPVSHREKRI